MKIKKFLKKNNQLRYEKLSVWLKIYNYFQNISRKNKKKKKNKTKKSRIATEKYGWNKKSFLRRNRGKWIDE